MRQITSVIFLAGLVALAGCSSTQWGWLKPERPASNVPAGEVPSVAALVEYLNDNANRVQTMRVEDLDVTVKAGSQSFGVAGQLITQKPRNFRMNAKTLGQPVVDLGSNEQEFWYWISKADPPYQVYCSYKDLQEGRVRRMPFPFQPEWVMETMGLGPYGPPQKYTLEHDRDTVKLVEKTVSLQGQPVRKVIVFKRNPVAPPHAQVTDYLLLEDATGKEICAAKINSVQIDRKTGSMLPKSIELRWPAEKMKMAMLLRDVSINGQAPPMVFQRQPLTGVQSFNLARMQIDNTPPPQAFSGLKTVQGLAP